jgi:hypothetical protein
MNNDNTILKMPRRMLMHKPCNRLNPIVVLLTGAMLLSACGEGPQQSATPDKQEQQPAEAATSNPDDMALQQCVDQLIAQDERLLGEKFDEAARGKALKANQTACLSTLQHCRQNRDSGNASEGFLQACEGMFGKF